MAPDSNQAELESLLSEYDNGTETSKPMPNAEIGKFARAIQPVVDYVNQDRVQKQQEQINADLKGILDFFSEADELKKMPEKLQRGFIETHAQENPDFLTAFQNKAKNPKAWNTARESARDALTELVSELPGSKVKTDVAAAQAAVDGDVSVLSSSDGLSVVKKMNMSDWEWKQYTEEQALLAEAS